MSAPLAPQILFVSVVIVTCAFHAAVRAQEVSPPDGMQPTETSTLARVRRTERHKGLTLTWGRDDARRRTMCASVGAASRTCYAPGLPRIRRARTRIALGALIATIGISGGAAATTLASWYSNALAGSAVVVGVGIGAGGLLLSVMGRRDRRAHRRGIEWLRAHDARLGVGSGLSLSLAF